MNKVDKFRFAIDRGGTFTDIYAEVPGKPGVMVLKLLSEDPRNYPDAPREGIRRIISQVTGRNLSVEELPTENIEWIRMGTTVATNALLERQGARCALLVTRGFRDILKIGNQDRPHLFDLEIKKPELLYEEVIEVDERLRLLDAEEEPPDTTVVQGITGERLAMLQEPDLKSLKKQLATLKEKGINSLAVVFMHSYAWPEHELMVGRLAREMGFGQISLSSRIMPMVKIVPRGDTAMVDAYLTPHIRSYLESFRHKFKENLKSCNLQFMRSDGGLTPADDFTGSRAILSGPAGGVVGYAMTTNAYSHGQPVIGFDMGGTSTDVSRYGGGYELVHESETAGVRIQAPQLHIKTVAAGGGSRLFYLNGMFKVGPESAGAHPGPICYRKNGYLAITDANLVLGRLQPDNFPHIFGPDENQPLDLEAARQAFADLTNEINDDLARQRRQPMTIEEVACGFIQVANEVMVRPIREISVLRGYDIKEHILATFGGAGPQHAVAIARALGIKKIFIHRYAGILSAYGMGLADVVIERQRPAAVIYEPGTRQELEAGLEELSLQAITELQTQGFNRENISTISYLNLRYQGTDTALMMATPDDGDYDQALAATYRREFGFNLEQRDIIVDDLRVRAVGKGSRIKQLPLPPADGKKPRPIQQTRCYFTGGWQETPVYQLEKLGPGQSIKGPALIIHDTATILVEPQSSIKITTFGDLEITLEQQLEIREVATTADPIQLSIFSNLFMSIAEQMGRTLQKTAISTNIKERLDFSCALFGPGGELVANAPHLPVHLGAMSEAVKAQIRLQNNHFKAGEVLVSNHPAAGGSHLPDITVITPVLDKGEPIFFVASRGHHADIGGISPGSMPPFSRRLEEEGACIMSFKLVNNGIFQQGGITALLREPGNLPQDEGKAAISGTRTLADNISDLKAQVAANQKGIELIREMIDRYSLEVVQAYMQHVQHSAEVAVRRSLKQLADKYADDNDQAVVIRAEDYMDDGSRITLCLTINHRDGSAVFDFSGTEIQVWGNTNAPLAVTKSAILYSLRCLIKEDLPLNYGCLIPITVIVEPGSLLDPDPEAAVVGGNVLTSQRVVDVILKAFGVAAASQGCMNNLTFGNRDFGYYETIGGGAGAGPHWHGQSGIHTHMTNTRITDPEILERRYPVLLRRFSLRQNSGGEGHFRGGDGLVREIEFLTPLNIAILSERRVFSPYGLRGGANGARGCNTFIRADGRKINLGGKNEIKANPGDCFRIETPGGGGYGK
ncbi:MAG: hydantoinase B/oxoprolinase family protein [Pseudomonadota bacterium]|nr:hydantoinase B/oxoprolinase family protein [Pseudomonadota bacterium]